MLRDLPDQRGAVVIGHHVARLDPAVLADDPPELLHPGLDRDGGGRGRRASLGRDEVVAYMLLTLPAVCYTSGAQVQVSCNIRAAGTLVGMSDHEHPAGPTADVSVRVGWADDAAGIAAVQVRAWRTEYADLLPAEVVASFRPDEFTAAWQTSLSSPKDARNRVLVALERNTIRGFAVTGPTSDPDADPIAHGEISELTVDPEHTRHGHGSRLVQACADTLRADRFGTALVWLNTEGRRTKGVPDRGGGWAPDGAHRELDLHGDGSVRVKQVRCTPT